MDDGESCNNRGQKEEMKTKKWKVYVDPTHEYDRLRMRQVFRCNFGDITSLNILQALTTNRRFGSVLASAWLSSLKN